jgi:hypothetical protein
MSTGLSQSDGRQYQYRQRRNFLPDTALTTVIWMQYTHNLPAVTIHSTTTSSRRTSSERLVSEGLLREWPAETAIVIIAKIPTARLVS